MKKTKTKNTNSSKKVITLNNVWNSLKTIQHSYEQKNMDK